MRLTILILFSAATLCTPAIASQQHDGINQYAQKNIGSPGKQDGLYWQTADGTPDGPISKPVARAIAEGYSTEGPQTGGVGRP